MSWVVLAVSSTVVSAGMQVYSGQAQKASLKSQAKTQEMEARVAELGVTQTAARRMEELMADLGAIRTRRATQNVAVGGSAQVAESAYEKEYLRALRSDILNQRYGIVSRRSNAAALRSGASAAALSGYAGAISTLAGGFQQAAGGKPKDGSP